MDTAANEFNNLAIDSNLSLLKASKKRGRDERDGSFRFDKVRNGKKNIIVIFNTIFLVCSSPK